jgi:hypothetical protein
MKYLFYFIIIFSISSCKKEEIILPQIKQPKGDSTLIVKSKNPEIKLKIKKKRKIKK